MINPQRVKVLATVAVIAGAAMLWTTQHQAQVRLRAENESLRRQTGRLTQLEKDNERLANLATQADGSPAKQQLMELLRLRNEVGMLRRQIHEPNQLPGQNERIQTEVTAGKGLPDTQNTNLTTAAQPLAVYPKASWSFAGYATPEDAFQSMIWAAANGDTERLLAGSTQDWQKEFAKSFENKSSAEASREVKESINANSEFRILDKETIGENLVIFSAVAMGEGGAENPSSNRFVYQRIDGQWKIVSGH